MSGYEDYMYSGSPDPPLNEIDQAWATSLIPHHLRLTPSRMKHVTIGMIGLGTVGTGVARLLTEHVRPHRPPRRPQDPLDLGRRPRPRKAAGCRLDGVRLTTDVADLIDDPEVDIIIETMGGTEPALEYVLAALAAGKHVVTANKALLAEHGAKVFAQARAVGSRGRLRG